MAYSRNCVDWEELMETYTDGMIFVVDSTTFTDVLKNRLFGLPSSYLKEMKLLTPERSALFYFERNTHTLAGIFTATAEAEANINTKIWKHRNGSCKFPAQIHWRSIAKLPSVPKSHPRLPKWLRSMKIKGKYLEPARLQELLLGYRNAIYGSNPHQSPHIPHNPYLTQKYRARPPPHHRKSNSIEGEVAGIGHKESYIPRQRTYASPELRPSPPALPPADWMPYRDDPANDGYYYEDEQRRGSFQFPLSDGDQTRFVHAAVDEFNRKLAHRAYGSDERSVAKPGRGGYHGARHRLYQAAERPPVNEFEKYYPEPYYNESQDGRLCY